MDAFFIGGALKTLIVVPLVLAAGVLAVGGAMLVDKGWGYVLAYGNKS